MANTTGKKFGGRKKGTPNKVNKKAREVIGDKIEDYLNNSLDADLSSLEAKERLQIVVKLMEFSLPRLKAVEMKQEIDIHEDPIDLTKLTEEELFELIRLLEKA